MNERIDVSVVIPVFNEQAVLDELLRRCCAVLEGLGRPWELILADDGSMDGSAERIRAAAAESPGRVIGVLLNRNYGQHAAVMAGMDQARGAMVVTLDADLQNPPEEIPRLVEKIDEGFDVVGTVREDRQDSAFRKISSWITNRAVQKATGVNMHDYGCMLRAYRRPIVDAMLQCPERSTFIPILANSFARRTTEILVGHAEREAGPSKYSVWKLVNLQLDLLTSMTTFPIRVLSILGTLISLAGFAFGALLLILRLIFGAHWAAQGVFTLFALVFIFIGAQFIGLGLLGEYIGRIYKDVRGRPRYFIQEIVGVSARPEKGDTQ